MFNTLKNKSSSLVLKSCKSVQETSGIADSLKFDSCSTDSYLSRFNEARQILFIKVSINNYENQFFRSNFRPALMYLCRVFFLTTLDIYKVYFLGRHIKEYKENICKR